MNTDKIIRTSYLVKGDQSHVYRASLPPIYQWDRGVQIKQVHKETNRVFAFLRRFNS